MNIKEKLKNYNQEHLLRFENNLSDIEKFSLNMQIEKLDFSYLNELNKKQDKQKTLFSPIFAPSFTDKEKEELEQIGIKALQNYEVGAVLLAGGMGTRLGSNAPKGMYNLGKTKDVFIFQRLFENLLDVVKKCGTKIPFFIMTSENNHEKTIDFLKEKNFFGYDENYIRFFIQETAPCTTFDGKILLEEKGKIATSPNGNGGWYTSLLADKNAHDMLKKFNIKWLNVFSVDNVLQKMADPVFIGATIAGGYQISSKVVKKTCPEEKVGVMCYRDNKPSVVEYFEFTEEMKHQKEPNGELSYIYGVTLNYLFNVDMLNDTKNNKLPVHVVTKKVPYINDKGDYIIPTEPNAHKFELLCVDLIEFANKCLPFVVEREKEFAPVKNKEGVDSVTTAQALLEKNGYIL